MIFAKAEYAERVDRVKKIMAARGIDLLVVTDPANMCYLSGYNAWSFYVHQAVIVAMDDAMPRFVGRYMDAFCGAVKTTWLSGDHVHAYSDDYVQSTLKHPMDYLAQLINELGYGSKTVGVEKDAYYFTAAACESLQQGLPQAKLADATTLVSWTKIIKSDAEIALMRKAGKIVEAAMQAAYDTIGVGVRECDVAACIMQAQVKGTAEFGGDYPSIVPLMPRGETSGAPHLTWTDKRYNAGDVVFIEIAGCYERYHSPMSRTISLGQPAPAVKKTVEITLEGLQAALDTVKPGVTCEAVEAAWRKVLAKYGYAKESRIGYSMGLNYPPDWGEHTASLRPGDQTVLQPNMTFHCIPGMYFDNFGVSISEAFRVTETGYETFARFPRELYIK
jgi:ectoine hydrolase